MNSRKTMIGLGLASAVVAAAIVLVLGGRSEKKTPTKRSAKPSATIPANDTPVGRPSKEALPLGYSWTVSIVSSSNLVVGDPEAADEKTTTVYEFAVVKGGVDGAPTTPKATDQIVRVSIRDGQGPFATPVFLRYRNTGQDTPYKLISGRVGTSGKEHPASSLPSILTISVPYKDTIAKRPRSTTQKADESAPPSDAIPPALPPADGGNKQSMPAVPSGSGTAPPPVIATP